MHRVLLALVVGSLLALACRAVDVAPHAARADTRAIEATLDELYRAFCFDAGEEADWDTIRALAAEGAVFVAPIAPGKTPRAVGIEDFLRDFQSYVASEAVRTTGLHERITHTRIDAFGHVAHAYVAARRSSVWTIQSESDADPTKTRRPRARSIANLQ